MNVQQESLGNSQVQLTIEVEPERVEAARKTTLRDLSKQVQVPGFRKGKAPLHLVERQANPAYVTEETFNHLIPTIIEEAVRQAGIEPYSYDDIEMDVLGQSPLTLRVVMPVMPTVKLGDLSGLSVEPIYPEVAEDAVEEALNGFREERALWEPLEESALEEDQVSYTLSGTFEDGLIALPPTDDNRVLFFTTFDDSMEMAERASLVVDDDIVRQLIGMAPDESKEFVLEYPAEHADEALAGKRVQATVTVNEVKRKQLPELDDEFAKEVSGDLETLEALRQRVADNIAAQAKDDALSASLERVLDALIDESDLDYPEAMVRREIHAQLDRLIAPLASYGIDRNRYLEIMRKSLSDMEDEMRDEAELRLRRSLVLSEYVRQQDLVVTPEELNQEIETLLRSAPKESRDTLRQEVFADRASMEGIQSRLITRKGLYQLYGAATGEEVPPLFAESEEVDDEPAQPVLEEAERAEHPVEEEWSNEGGTPVEGDVTPPASGPTQEELETDTVGAVEAEPVIEEAERTEHPVEEEWSNEGGTPVEGDVTPPASGPTQDELDALADGETTS